MKKTTLFIAAVCMMLGGVFAQNSTYPLRVKKDLKRCSTAEMMQAVRNMDPAAYDANKALKEQQYQDWIANDYANFMATRKAVITIPVVVQIWENTSTVPDSRVTEQLNRLNQDFRGTNPDRSNTPSVFPTADCEIEFCLANIDPSGNPTTGIIRRTPGGSPPSQGGTEMWDPTKYLNIYVYGIGGGVLGFTYLSSQLPNNAVHIGTSYFGNTGGTYGMGRTAVHEIGHWLNLEHIWGDANCGNDFVGDTPPAQSDNFGCPNHPHDVGVCGNSDGEMFMNYMDYVNDACMYAFTPGQKARMVAAINNDRPGLLTSNGCTPTTLTAQFNANVTTINAGQTVTFTDNSIGPNTITSWNWDFDVTNIGGVSPSTANTQGAHVVTYNNPGTYTVSLQVGDGSGNDIELKSGYILVNPAGTQSCDSTLATWDFATHAGTTGAFYWGQDCNGPNPSGYILGQNCYNDNGWADKVTYSGSGDFLTDVLIYFGTATGSSNVNLKVWGEAGGGEPDNGNILEQQSVAISSLSTGGTPTLWSLPSPPSLTGDFFVGFDHNTLINGDTVALMSASTGTNTVWAYESTNSWVDLDDYGLDHSGAIIPVVCNNISTGEKEILGEINEVTIFPNPSRGTINIALTEKGPSSVEIYSVVGKLVKSTQIQNTQLITIDVSDQPNGVYFVNVKTDKGVITKKVMVSK